jgi:hypothetical protein
MINPMIIDGEEYVSRKYCATFLNVGVQRVIDFIKDKRLKTLKIGKKDWIKMSDLETFANFSKEQKSLIKEFSEKRRILRDKHLKEIKEFNVVKQKKFNELKKKYCPDAIGSLMGMSNCIGENS